VTASLATVLAEERRIMNLYAPHYDDAMLTNSYVYQLERAAFVAWAARTVRASGGRPDALTVLDAGCGPGTVTALLAREGFARLVGLDLADGMLAEARKRALPGAHWVRATIEDAPFPPATFDAIVAGFTLHHLHDPQAFFHLVDRALRPGGWFFALEYDDSRVAAVSHADARRALGDAVRRAFARKNRRALAARPVLPPLFNPAHRALRFEEIRQAMPDPAAYDLHRESRGVLLPVLVDESALDRLVARGAGAADRWLERRAGGLFQWIAGRRR
jgi:SAM-dependent methyltransferase